MAELIEADQSLEVPVHQSLLNDISKELDGVKDKWREIGEALKVSEETLDDLQNHSKGAKGGGGFNDKENFDVVMKEWIEKNMGTYMWPPLLQALNNIHDLDLNLEKLNNTYCHHDDSPNTDSTWVYSCELLCTRSNSIGNMLKNYFYLVASIST